MLARSFFRSFNVTLLTASALTWPSLVAAQEEPTVLERILVQSESNDILVQEGYVAKQDRIGTKVDTPIADIPQAISVVAQDQIEDQKPRTLNETLSYTASANPNGFGFDSRYDAFTLRGFPAYYNGIYRDGLRQFNGPSAWFKTEPYGIEGLTVLKGPASSLYGISGPGGMVNLVTKRPKDEQFREVEVLLGGNDRYQAAFDFSGPVDEDETFLYRLTGLARTSNTDLLGYPDDKLYLAPAFTWKPDEDTKLTVLGEISQAVTGGTGFFYNPAYGEVSDLYEGDPAWNDFVGLQGRIGYEFEHRFNDVLTVRQNMRFNAVDADLQYSGHYVADPTDPDTLSRYWGHYKENMKNFAVDNMAQFEFDTGPVSHTAVAGIDYSWTDYDAMNGISYVSVDDIANMPLSFSGSQRMHQVGAYVHDQMQWNNFTLFASGRHDWVDTRSVDYLFTDTDQNDNAFSGRVGLSYRTDWGIIPYANYSTSFSPNIGFVYDSATNARMVARPTKGEQVEVGVKYEIPDYNAVINAAVFNIDQTDGVVYDGTFDDAGNQRQRQLDLNSRGFELEAAATLDNGLGLVGSYTYMRMKIERGAAGTEGNELSSSPNHIFSLWGHYRFADAALAGLGLGAGVRYVGESFGDDLNSFKNEDRVFFDAAVSYDFGARNPELEGLLLQVNAKNLFDERKKICTAGNCYWDEGRSVYGSLRYRF
ncbi:TonB-dependent siderophore receptor [Mesorhizobium microcysteis]|uniref:TonB-dependent siderophore receptor n=1 Tax=Neoaquamicrobium microcysteis TaxID=2682781 RepID=A0A5D4GVZ0_9HYPH|nr:TonB-dependent siderophore receptor [Mesorhizobium microcysteis]TYR32886.1 TonB-dependent siderophore receptor [Mesorhizobium microcysteis]